MMHSPFQSVLGFFGHPFTALTVTALACMYVFGFRRGLDRNAVTRMATDSWLLSELCLPSWGEAGLSSR